MTLVRGPGAAVALLAAALSAPLCADQSDPGLEPLFETLRGAESRGTAARAEAAIWQIWLESGRDDVERFMTQGIAAMSAGDLESAIAAFDRVLELAPEFAEGWNKRATALYLDSRYAESVRDIERTLALEPRHFGAISGMGLIFLERRDAAGALRAFEEVLRINPHAAGARERVEILRRHLRGKGA